MCHSPGMFQENKTFLLMSIISNGIEYLRQVGFGPVYGNFISRSVKDGRMLSN